LDVFGVLCAFKISYWSTTSSKKEPLGTTDAAPSSHRLFTTWANGKAATSDHGGAQL
jgi:hypothetical protein